MKRLVFMFAVLAAVVYIGCQEGDGGRCQVDSDCNSNNCSKTQGTCVPAGGGTEMFDAEVPDSTPDAPDAQ